MNTPANVLFLCTGNSARSIMVEALLNRLGEGRFRAFSAGSFPKGTVRPEALALLQAHGLPTEGLRSKAWDEFACPCAPALDFVFTLCDQAASEPCPAWPGQPITAHRGVPDPAAVDGSEAIVRLAFRDVFLTLEGRIKLFTALPLAQLARVAIQRKVDEIGRIRPDSVIGVAS
jgi:arsenate reductase